jgi:1A family penicillin-binding protein
MKRALSALRERRKKLTRAEIRNYATLAVSAFFVLGGLFSLWVATLEIPTLDSFSERRISESTKIYDATGETILYDVNQDVQRTVIPFAEISPNIKNATIAIEDQEFYSHGGIKPRAILRAVIANIFSLEFSQGGSTITQQLIKNTILSRDKTIARKIKEWVLAVKLDGMLTKDQILELYLNEIPYGGNVYGIEEASQTFFGKSARDLTLAEAAYLAALPQAPSFFSPYGRNVARLEARKNLVLKEMRENGFITEEEYVAAKADVVTWKPKETENIKAPHFVFMVLDELTQRFGEEAVMNGGLRVTTSLNYEMQKKAEEIAKRFGNENEEKFNAENTALVAIDPKSGAILSLVGSRDYFDTEIDGAFNIATALRQPGSTFKPFVYAAAFEKGYTPETILFDVQTQFSTSCAADNFTSLNGCYSPQNYDNLFRGPMTMRNSLAQSINVTSVKTLYLAGIRDSIRLAEAMGITTLGNPGRYGLTLVLGGGEVRLLDMTPAYGVFANEGIRNEPFAVKEVRDRSGNILFEHNPSPTEALPRNIALMVSDVLSDNSARTPAFGSNSLLNVSGRDVAVKTGTTNDYKDAWIIGYTPSVVIGAWAGNNDNTPMEKRVAGFIVAPVWRAFMDEVLQKVPGEPFPAASIDSSYSLKPVLRGEWRGGRSVLIDTVSGKLATERTPKETTREFLSGGVRSILHWVDRSNPRGPAPENPESDSQYRLWESAVARWVASQNLPELPQAPNVSGFDDVHTPENSPVVSATADSDTYIEGDRVIVRTEISSKFPIRSIDYLVNGEPAQFSMREPGTVVIDTEGIPAGPLVISVTATDEIYNRTTEEITVSLVSR